MGPADNLVPDYRQPFGRSGRAGNLLNVPDLTGFDRDLAPAALEILRQQGHCVHGLWA